MKHTLTLTRWHKVAERVNAALKERDARAVAAFTAATISPWNKEGVEQKAAAIGARAKADLAIVEAGTAAVAAIRAALARKNAELGIAARLAEVEAANRRIALYRTVLDKQSVDMVEPEHVRHVPAHAVPEGESSWARRDPPRITLPVAGLRLPVASRCPRVLRIAIPGGIVVVGPGLYFLPWPRSTPREFLPTRSPSCRQVMLCPW